ncbi:MAG: DUF2461 family protein [Gammaproteobacteria bacterium]|nr:DUF2461 family protein [Gammaproteobacteria bacterium]
MGDFRASGPQALAFFKALKFHQSKAWFDENRGLYESDVVEPMIAPPRRPDGDLRQAEDPAEGRRQALDLPGSIANVRFARDKSPYKTHAGAVMTRSGDKKEQGLLYVHIDPEGLLHRRRLLHARGGGTGGAEARGADLAGARRQLVARSAGTGWNSGPSTS